MKHLQTQVGQVEKVYGLDHTVDCLQSWVNKPVALKSDAKKTFIENYRILLHYALDKIECC